MPTGTAPRHARDRPATAGVEADALSALANLGYRRIEAHPDGAARARPAGRSEAGLDAVIRDSLKELAR